ncbi:MAG: hypothetical protein M1828_003759 [Chrysothrix sp. TS-e1954]|nr:MAG: hypothetical protein M1828_003759 [Chrysothrix sp. TS-e1954]
MDVSLYVYDLTKGLARQMSMQFLGIQLDAVYHTAIVLNNVEYYFGAGIHTTSPPGSTHHGRPMEVISLGRTDLPADVIEDYLQSLSEIYTPESYDLFVHNCNNFSHDFATFLVGKGIPEHITSLPRRVLDTPFGQMLKPQLDAAMRPITQAPNINSNTSTPRVGPGNAAIAGPSAPKARPNGAAGLNGHTSYSSVGVVNHASNLSQLDSLLAQARSTCAVIFFTSSTCPPCKLVYPLYDELAAQHGPKTVLIKVDIGAARDVAAAYSIRATPTFISFLKGEKQETWQGANPTTLKGNVNMLVQSCFPPHQHQALRMPTFLRASLRPAIYTKVPPLEKLTAKRGDQANEISIVEAVTFIKARNAEGSKEAPLPDLPQIGSSMATCQNRLPQDTMFAAYDLFRLMMVDARVSGYYLAPEEAGSSQTKATLSPMLKYVNGLGNSCPYNLRLVAVHLACNLFSSHETFHHIILESPVLSSLLVTLVSESLLDKDHASLRVAASSLAFNLTAIEHLARVSTESGSEKRSITLASDLQTQLAACLIEFLSSESESQEAIRGAVISLGRLAYLAPKGSEVLDLCRAMDAGAIVKQKVDVVAKGDVKLVEEVGGELLGKGLR